ncbi:MAG TPA: MFS transporter [Clostridia bacterium]|nr:MFS transporter [Clostridia bacterium]
MKKHYFSAYAGLPREVYFLFAARLVNAMGSFIMPLLTLILTQKLGHTKSDAGGMISFLILTEAPCLILGGKLTDSIGRKKIIVICSLAGAFLYILCGLLEQGNMMVLFIVLASDFYTITFPAFNAMLADLTKQENRRSAFSLMYFGMNIGMSISPIIGGLLFKDHLQLLFLLDAVTTIGYTIVIARNVPETLRHKKEDTDSPEPPVEKHSLYSVLKCAPILVTFIFLLFLYDFCYSQWNFMLPAQFGDMFGQDGARLFSMLCSANGFTVILLTPIVTSLSHRFRPLAIIAAGGLMYFSAYLGFAFGNNLAMFFFFVELFTLGEIVTTIQIEAFVTGHSPADCRGRISAFENFVRGSAGAFGPLVMGHVLTATGYQKSWLLIAFLIFIGGSGMILLNRKDRREIPS